MIKTSKAEPGGGAYDTELRALLKNLRARGLVLMVVDGFKGTGFSVGVDPDYMQQWLREAPTMLRMVADEIERDLPPHEVFDLDTGDKPS